MLKALALFSNIAVAWPMQVSDLLLRPQTSKQLISDKTSTFLPIWIQGQRLTLRIHLYFNVFSSIKAIPHVTTSVCQLQRSLKSVPNVYSFLYLHQALFEQLNSL